MRSQLTLHCIQYYTATQKLKPYKSHLSAEKREYTSSDALNVYQGTFFFFLSFCLLMAAPAYGGSQARGLIGSTAASLGHSHSNTGSEPNLRPTPQFIATPDP